MREAKVLLLPGDGIGPEVVTAAAGLLRQAALIDRIVIHTPTELIGGAAIDATGEALPEATLKALRNVDAVLLGAVGGPRWAASASVRPEQGLLALRAQLGVYANLRPVKPYALARKLAPVKARVLRDVDFVVVRELTGGSYFGRKQRDATSAIDECRYTVAEIERVTRVAARMAAQRRGKLTHVDKANVLETSRLWREVVTRVVGEEYPGLELEHQLVDSMAMHLIARPASFDVILTENLFGDILTDEAALLAGSLGLLPSAALGDGPIGLYEPIHGSAPDLAGRDQANPVGAILSAALLLEHSLNAPRAARALAHAVEQCLNGRLWTRDLNPRSTLGTQAFATAVSAELAAAWPLAKAA